MAFETLTPLAVIKQRRDFLAAARARKWAAPSMIVQGRDRREGGATRFGLTCSKKVGDAVARNRAKRRLRAAATQLLPTLGRPGWDYVLIGRQDKTAQRDWADLLADLETALARLHAPKARK